MIDEQTLARAEDLVGIMEQQAEALRRLLRWTEKKKEFLMTRGVAGSRTQAPEDARELQRVLAGEGESLQEIESLEELRMQAARALWQRIQTGAAGITAAGARSSMSASAREQGGEPTLRQLIERLERLNEAIPAGESGAAEAAKTSGGLPLLERLKAAQREIGSTVAQVAHNNQVNQGLLRQGLDYIQFSLNALASAAESVPGSYGPDGRISSGAAAGGMELRATGGAAGGGTRGEAQGSGRSEQSWRVGGPHQGSPGGPTRPALIDRKM